MLGNFSFGDYFKEDAIAWAWEFLTEWLKIKKDKLWVSTYKDDNEAYKIWKDKIRVPEDKIVKLGDKENFWPSEAKEKGPNGPCGPCSEIFFDQGSDVGCKRPDCNPACSCGRFVEVWNLVFTQFNRKEGGLLEPLPKRNIDTGMGLERLAAVMQGVDTNFATDLFKPIIKEIATQAKQDDSGNKGLIYAVADHIRAIVFAIYDGILPSNDGRGYVVRKLIRKSALYLRALGMKRPFLYKLAPVVAEIMKRPYPDLAKRRENISEVILAEEKNFIEILDSCQKLFNDEGFRKSDPVGTAHKAFKLYDTYGIPFELIKEWLDKNKIEISVEAFNQDLAVQKERSKQQSMMKGAVFDTRDSGFDVKATKFSGYRDYELDGKILKVLKGNSEVKNISKGDEAKIILDQTPFYGESGGQVGDTGVLIKGRNVFEVSNTKRFDKIIVHIGEVKEGSFKDSGVVKAKVDVERRLDIARNHTATHLLQAALRKVLGVHVQQQGSLVAPDRLRFDFTHFKNIDEKELARIEEIVNSFILNNYALKPKQTTLLAAKKRGALAFFGEKYGNKVRIVSIEDISQELCGGTHLDFTGQIGLFKILQEGSIAQGVRRIEAVTGSFAYKLIKEQEYVIDRVSSVLNVPADKIMQELEKRSTRIRELEKQLTNQRYEDLKEAIDEDIKNKKLIGNISLITHVDNDIDSVRKAVDLIKEKMQTNTVIFSSTGSNLKTIFVTIGITDDLCAKGIDSVALINGIAPDIGGSGGGRKDFAQAGGNKPENFKKIGLKLEEVIRRKLPPAVTPGGASTSI
jgi:alanyl-tRNA synthetase